MRATLYIGPKIRELRELKRWRLEQCAERLGISVSYLSQIESNQRPATPRVMVGLIDVFDVPPEFFEFAGNHRLIADLRGALAELGTRGNPVPVTELKQVAETAPNFVRHFLSLHREYQRLNERLNLTDEAIALDETAAASSLLPYEEVRDFFQDKDNYVDSLDTAAEKLATEIGIGFGAPLETLLEQVLARKLGVSVVVDAAEDMMRSYDPRTKTLCLNPSQPTVTRTFQMAYHLVQTLLNDQIELELKRSGFRTSAAVEVCRIGLANFGAGALLMPYRRFAAAARESRHDLDRLSLMFQVSLEQVCHRLSTLQRADHKGIPFYFVKLDHAGNITKRHSATRFRFARFGGACPLWNVHEAVSAPDKFLVQIAEMPDGDRYLCVARSIIKPSGSYLIPDRKYVLGIGCELTNAEHVVYSQGVNLRAPPTRIGVSCRICERNDCAQRAFPPVDRPLNVPLNERRIVPFSLPDIEPQS
jgi:predicted transcriptional regulator